MFQTSHQYIYNLGHKCLQMHIDRQAYVCAYAYVQTHVPPKIYIHALHTQERERERERERVCVGGTMDNNF